MMPNLVKGGGEGTCLERHVIPFLHLDRNGVAYEWFDDVHLNIFVIDLSPFLSPPLPPSLVLCPFQDSLSQLPAPRNPKVRLHNAEQVLSWEPVSLSNDTRPVVYQVQHK